jgi:outer membrane protein
VIRNTVIATVAAALLAGTASADTMREALVSAYQTNPTLMGQRETLKGTDANVAIAKAAGRPQLSATAGLNRDLSRSGILKTPGGNGAQFSLGADLSVPVYSGGRVRNSIEASKIRVEAGRATLRAVEGDVFTQAVSAYMDVIRDRAVVELNANNVRVLETNLQATKDRFEIGDLTRTDVAQSEARLQLGRSRLAVAQGQLTASEATYRQVIGHPPGDLAPPPPLPPLPATESEAVKIALADNPDLLSIQRQAVASGYDVRVAEGTRYPTVAGVVSGTYLDNLNGSVGGLPHTGSETAAGVNVSMPLYQGGLPAARIRQAEAQRGELLEQTVGTERAVVAATRSAFANYEASQRAIQSQTVAVSANELALEGTRAEQSVGTRTVLNVLDAEQELLNSQVLLVTARRDAYVAGFQLLNAMGQAEAQDLGLDGGPLYDPLGNYRRVANNWNDWARDPKYVPVSTRTVDASEMPPNPIVTPDVVAAPFAPSVPPPLPVNTAPASTPVTTTQGVTPPKQ